LIARLEFRLNFLGHLRRFFFRVPPLFIELRFGHGKNVTYRIVPETAGDGYPVNFLPKNLAELGALFAGKKLPAIESFKIDGPGIPCYAGELRVSWEKLSARPE